LDLVGPFTNPAQSAFPQPLDLIEVLIFQLHYSIFSQDPEETDKAEEWAYFGEWNAPGATTSDKDLFSGYPTISLEEGEAQFI
jgi:hypothetical protein